jgi:hypothetical protein
VSVGLSCIQQAVVRAAATLHPTAPHCTTLHHTAQHCTAALETLCGAAPCMQGRCLWRRTIAHKQLRAAALLRSASAHSATVSVGPASAPRSKSLALLATCGNATSCRAMCGWQAQSADEALIGLGESEDAPVHIVSLLQMTTLAAQGKATGPVCEGMASRTG